MRNSDKTEINSGYLEFVENISDRTDRSGKTKKKISLNRGNVAMVNLIRIFNIPLLFFWCSFLFVLLHVLLAFRRKKITSAVHNEALRYVPEFIDQYPLHLYPIVAKSLELAFIELHLPGMLEKSKTGIVDLAVGEGTFSERIFSDKNVEVVGIDLNPYSLVHATKLSFMKNHIVGDCIDPPLAEKGAFFLMSNNFLHHVTQKEKALKNWAKIAPFALFNENTEFWASGWAYSYIFKLVGLAMPAGKVAKAIEKTTLQELWTAERVDALVRKFYDILSEASYLSEWSFFFCSMSSVFLVCLGPPTPKWPKKIVGSRFLKPITKTLSLHLANAIIEFDAGLSREKDTYRQWLVKSKRLAEDQGGKEVICVCPQCRGVLRDNQCQECKKSFRVRDGMLFLLSEDLEKKVTYRGDGKNALGREHL